MATKQKFYVDYFPHNFKDGKKMRYIEKKYKNDGYATWYKILEELGAADLHYLQISDQITFMDLSAKCNITEELLTSIIADLIKLEVFDALLYAEGIIYSQKFVDSIEDAYKRRANKIVTRESLCIHLLSKGIQLSDKCIHVADMLFEKNDIYPETILNYTKLDKTKLNKTKDIPTELEFLEYCKKIPDINYIGLEFSLKAKYKAWVENNFKDGNNNEIKNWKTKILNTIPYLKSNGTNKQNNASTETFGTKDYSGGFS